MLSRTSRPHHLMSNQMTASQCLFRNAEKYGDLPALSTRKGEAQQGVPWEWNTDTWSEVLAKAMSIAKAIHALGYNRHDTLSI